MKKLTVLLSVVVLLSLVLTACSPKQPAPVEEPAVEEPVVEEPAVEEPVVEEPEPVDIGLDLEGVEVQFWHVYSDKPGEALQALVDEFNETNPYGIKVNALDQGSYRDVEDKMNAGIQSGDLPDVVMAYTNTLADWHSVGFIVDLNPYINDPVFGLTAEQKADLYPHLEAAGSTPDGSWIAYPLTQSANVLVYNFTWAEELGFANPPATAAELKDVLCAAAADNEAIGGDFAGTGGLVYQPNTTNWLHFLYAFSGNELSDTGDAYDFNSQEAIDTSMYLLDLKADGCAWQTDDYPNPEQGQRRAIITMSSTAGLPYYTEAFADANNDDEWGFLAAPGPDGHLAVNAFLQTMGVVPSIPEYETASWLFIKWLTSPEIQARWVPLQGYYGTQYATEALLAGYGEENPIWEAGVKLAALGPAEPQTFPAWSAVRRLIGDYAAELYNAADEADVVRILGELTQAANDAVAEIQ